MEEKRIRDIMFPIEQYSRVNENTTLRDALKIILKNREDFTSGKIGYFHETVFIVDARDKITGKLSIYDIVKGLVPEHAKDPALSRILYSVLSSRSLEVVQEVKDFQESFEWLHRSFKELVTKEAEKKVKDIMSPVHPVLNEQDTINHAVYAIFKENIRQPLVVRDGKIIGVVNLKAIFDEILEVITTI